MMFEDSNEGVSSALRPGESERLIVSVFEGGWEVGSNKRKIDIRGVAK